jgi:hypothetical protein
MRISIAAAPPYTRSTPATLSSHAALWRCDSTHPASTASTDAATTHASHALAYQTLNRVRGVGYLHVDGERRADLRPDVAEAARDGHLAFEILSAHATPPRAIAPRYTTNIHQQQQQSFATRERQRSTAHHRRIREG